MAPGNPRPAFVPGQHKKGTTGVSSETVVKLLPRGHEGLWRNSAPLDIQQLLEPNVKLYHR